MHYPKRTDSNVSASNDQLDLKIKPDGVLDFNGQDIPYTQTFLEDLADAFEMPKQYAYDIDFDLLTPRLNEAPSVLVDTGPLPTPVSCKTTQGS
jgi:hypothetical protein